MRGKMAKEERTLGLCKNCKYWKKPKSSWEEGYGDCRFLKTEGGEAKNRIAYSYDEVEEISKLETPIPQWEEEFNKTFSGWRSLLPLMVKSFIRTKVLAKFVEECKTEPIEVVAKRWSGE